MKTFFLFSLITLALSYTNLPTSEVCEKYTKVKTNTTTGKSVITSKESLKIADVNRKMVFDMFFIKEGKEVIYLLTSNKPLIVKKHTKVKVKFADGSSMKAKTTNSGNVENTLTLKFESDEKNLMKLVDRRIERIEFKTNDMKFDLKFGGYHTTYMHNTLDCLLSRV